jgi:hypothetical protein
MRLGTLALALQLGVAGISAADELTLTPIGDGPIAIPGIGNAELSGVVWLGGSRFLAVDDGDGLLVELDLVLDEETGAVRSFVASVRATLAEARDPEGIAIRPGHESLLVVDEGHRDLREYDASSGELLRKIAPPPRYEGRLKKNTGFEGITSVPDGDTVWVATEGPLRLDGSGPTVSKGGWIRLQRFDASLEPTAQYAYQTETGIGYVGVVDLLATPEGELLVLERALVGTGFAARVFQVDISRATDVTDFEKLRNRDDFQRVWKRPVWERRLGFQNFEGMALGPPLGGGGRLVLLVSDGGGHREPQLLPLRMKRPVPAKGAPAPGAEAP